MNTIKSFSWNFRAPVSLFSLLVLFLSLNGCAPVFVKQDPWFGRDKLYHFAATGIIGAYATRAARSNGESVRIAPVIGITTALGVGGGKEFYDLKVKKTYWSWKDFIWDFAGGTAGSYAVLQ
jgi:putative lipoprotein